VRSVAIARNLPRFKLVRSGVEFFDTVIVIDSADIVRIRVAGRRILAHEITISITTFGVAPAMLIVVRDRFGGFRGWHGLRVKLETLVLGSGSVGSMLPKVARFANRGIFDQLVGSRRRLGVPRRVAAHPGRRIAVIPAAVKLWRPDTSASVHVLG
jgi:hypothetical protein